MTDTEPTKPPMPVGEAFGRIFMGNEGYERQLRLQEESMESERKTRLRIERTRDREARFRLVGQVLGVLMVLTFLAVAWVVIIHLAQVWL